VRASDFFTMEDDPFPSGAPWGAPAATTIFNEVLVDSQRKGSIEGVKDSSAALALLDLVGELEAYGTGGGEQLTDPQIAMALRALEAVTRRVGVPLELPFRDFTRFRSYWIQRGASGSGGWQARRDLLEELLEPTRRQVERLGENPSGPQIHEQLIANLRDPAAIREQIDRITRAVLVDDPALVIGSAKELVESTAKAVLLERTLPVNDKDDLPAIVTHVQLALGLHPSSVGPGPDGTDAVKKSSAASSRHHRPGRTA
jgi:hypothetical protein